MSGLVEDVGDEVVNRPVGDFIPIPVVEQGAHLDDDLLTLSGRYAELFTLQAAGYR